MPDQSSTETQGNENQKGNTTSDIFKKIGTFIVDALVLLFLLHSCGLIDFKKETEVETVSYSEEIEEPEMTEEEKRIEEIIHTPVYLVEPQDYEIWCEHNPFEFWMITECWLNCDSSALEGVSYCAPYRAMGIMFTNEENTCYVYWDVPRSIASELADSDSPGKFYNENIKGEFDVTKYVFNKDERIWVIAD